MEEKVYKTKLKEKQDYGTGATRDAVKGKGRFDLIPDLALTRLAGVYERGGLNHGDRNWEQGLPLSRMIDSATRHLTQYKMSKYTPELDDEDHLAHAAWNILGIMHVDDMIKRGSLPEKLDDLPRYERYQVDDQAILKLETDLQPFKIELNADQRTVRVSHETSGHCVTKFHTSEQRYNYFCALKELKEILEHTGEITAIAKEKS
jgi:hypothetical protein